MDQPIFLFKDLPVSLASSHAWLATAGRRTVHAALTEDLESSCCGQTRWKLVNPACSNSPVCKQCLMAIVTNIYGQTYKFFYDHVPAEVKAKRRQKWRAWLKELALT